MFYVSDLPSRYVYKDLPPKRYLCNSIISQWEISDKLGNCDLQESDSIEYLEIQDKLEKQREHQGIYQGRNDYI